MPISLYQASIPTFIGMLGNLSTWLDKAEAHAQAAGMPPSILTEARLAPDMHPFTRQIQIASDAAKGAGARLAGAEPPAFADEETTFPQLKARVAKTVAYLKTLAPASIDGHEERSIELKIPNRTLKFSATDFLFQFALPNFYFHIVTAYGLLRGQGVPLGKMDFLTGGRMP